MAGKHQKMYFSFFKIALFVFAIIPAAADFTYYITSFVEKNERRGIGVCMVPCQA